MARRTRSSSRQQGDPSRPNPFLVILVVLFFLTTAGLGGWVYSMFNERYKASEQVQKVENINKGLENDLNFAKGVGYAWRAMMGDETFKDNTTEEYRSYKDFLKFLDERYAEVRKKEGGGPEGDGEKKGELTADEQHIKKLRALIKQSQDDLGWDDPASMYKTTYRDLTVKLTKERDDARIATKQYLPDKLASDARLRGFENQYVGDRKKMFKDIADGNDKAMKQAEKYLDDIKAANANNDKLQKEKQTLITTHLIELKKKDVEINKLQAKLQEQGVNVAVAPPPPPPTKAKEDKAGGPTGYSGMPHALLLDISKGKPLWDRPRGRIIRVDEKDNRVFIDRGSEHGLTPQMTFNVFGAGWDNKAEKMLKGTIEVVQVGPKTSQARLTSLYDAEGREISLGDPSPNKIVREAGNPIKEGDLLFNLAWGSHVALAGVLDWNGQDSQTPAGQAEDLDQFRQLLKAQGITVDCYIDLRDGKIYGAIKPGTNYLIRGYGFGGIPEAQQTERMREVNKSILALRKEAVERGLFVISPENFGLVIGYRRPASALSRATLDFRPSLPAGGTIGGAMPGIGGAPEKK